MAPVVDMLHFYPLENAKRHFTERFELVHGDPDAPDEIRPDTATPVLRRGQKFHVALRMQAPWDPDTDQVRIVFTTGPNPNGLKGTRGVIRVTSRVDKAPSAINWRGKILKQSEDTVTLELFAPIDCPVGAWQVAVEVGEAPSTSWDYGGDVFILFNPWCKDDQVHMADAALLDEYVLSDVGKVWVGPWGSSRGREWVFGQFDDCVLPAIEMMLERAGLAHAQRGDPVLVSRTISKIVNSNDDRGVLVGRWDGEYEDGTAPAAWTGSAAILEQFLETGEEVNYGQCWVFAGVVTTVCRALGIPSRVVSNLVSAHDANASLTVDKYYDKDDVEIEGDPNNPNGEDSIWNYHVWNDVWMARPDLPKGYGGWQAVDATPQETSDGVYQCGPASLEAIRQGQVGYRYDVPFMLASVNADLMRWKEDSTCDLGYRRVDCNKYHIGRIILTKAPWIFDPNGDQDREDITSLYKAREGSDAERLTLYNAVRSTVRAKRFYALPDALEEDVTFRLVELERVAVGKSFCLTVNILNTSKEVRTVTAVLSAGSVFYTGVKATTVKKATGKFVLQPGAKEQLSMEVSPDEYLDKLVEYCIMKLYAIASVVETKQTWADEDDFQVLKPTIDIKLPVDILVGKPCATSLSFRNPLNKPLTQCTFRLAGPGLVQRSMKLSHCDAAPGGELRIDVTLYPKMAGDVTLVATFDSKELVDVTGSAKVQIYE